MDISIVTVYKVLVIVNCCHEVSMTPSEVNIGGIQNEGSSGADPFLKVVAKL
jgi:hypothetical protein